MSRSTTILLAVATVLGTTSAASEFIGDRESFISKVVNSDEVWVVAFYDGKSGCCTEDKRNKQGEYRTEDVCTDECKGFMETWEGLKLKKINKGMVDITTGSGKELAIRAGAYYGGTPNLKLYKSKTASVTIMDKTTGVRPLKRIKTALKNGLEGLELGSSGKYTKKEGQAEAWADTVDWTYNHFDGNGTSTEGAVCFEAGWCPHSSGIPANCGVWARTCSCSCGYAPRRADRRDSGIDTYPTDHKWFDRSLEKFIPTAKFVFQGGSWVLQPEETHDEL